MKRPYIICHMTMSVDGKVTGDFLYSTECEKAVEIYYEINREFKADAYACGRITMEGSFTGGWQPDLTAFSDAQIAREDYVADKEARFFAVAFDRRGKLGWKASKIEDEDPGYGKAHIIEVLCENVQDAYLAYLQSVGVSYIFAGKQEMGIHAALEKLKSLFGIEKLLLEGGSIINGAFAEADVIDELSLIVTPIVAKAEDKPLFYESVGKSYALKNATPLESGVVWLQYQRKLKVAFVCVHNSCRSQMAEAFGKKYLSDICDCYSAGTETKPQINQDAVRIMKERYGIDMEETQYSKLLSDIPEVDAVITMGCNVQCPYLPCEYRADWGLEDPSGKEDAEFVKTAELIKEKVLQLPVELGKMLLLFDKREIADL